MCKAKCATQISLEDSKTKVEYLTACLQQEVDYSQEWADKFKDSDPQRSERHAKRAQQLRDILNGNYELKVTN